MWESVMFRTPLPYIQHIALTRYCYTVDCYFILPLGVTHV